MTYEGKKHNSHDNKQCDRTWRTVWHSNIYYKVIIIKTVINTD